MSNPPSIKIPPNTAGQNGLTITITTMTTSASAGTSFASR